MNSKVDFYFTKAKAWQAEILALRTIVLKCPLTEVLKWGCPCYTHDAGNIVLIHVFKNYCALLFFKGALLADPHGILVQQTRNVQSARQVRFTGLDQITILEPLLKSYISQAIAVDKAGLKVDFHATPAPVPEEFQTLLDDMPEVETAFEGLTPGRQKGYLLHFAAPKQSKTRTARVKKAMPQILAGKGLDDP